ncbi:MAG TPA: hypothetical protein VIH88_08165 [Candidatus Acidoferrales bacterium]
MLSDDRATAAIGAISTKPKVAGQKLGAWLVSHHGPPFALCVARFRAEVIGNDSLAQCLPANPYFLLRDGLHDSTAEIEPFAFENFRMAVPVIEDLVQVHGFLCAWVLIESQGSQIPSRERSGVNSNLPVAHWLDIGLGDCMLEAVPEGDCSLLHTLVF